MIIVAMGGYSTERKVSLKSGTNIYHSLVRLGIPTAMFDYSGSNIAELILLNPKLVFIALHGRGGEDGELQQLLEQHHIPYTGCDSATAAKTLHKGKTQHFLREHQLPVANSMVLTEQQSHTFDYSQLNLRPPFAVKPVCEGSSIGISKANIDSLEVAVKLALKYDTEVIIEEWIQGRELTVPVISIKGVPTALPPIEIITTEEFYNYHAKYISDTTQYVCPAPISNEILQELSSLAVEVFTLLKCKDWVRVDFLLTKKPIKTPHLYILEINTTPGMTSHSLVPQSAQKYGLSFDELILTIIKSAGYDVVTHTNS